MTAFLCYLVHETFAMILFSRYLFSRYNFTFFITYKDDKCISIFMTSQGRVKVESVFLGSWLLLDWFLLDLPSFPQNNPDCRAKQSKQLSAS